MAAVAFDVDIPLTFDAKAVWDLLIDWQAHEDFVPATTVDIESVGENGVGTIFTSRTGFGPLTLVDRMRVTELSWDDETNSGYCEVDKLGPVLDGMAGIRVVGSDSGAIVTWIEDLEVAKLPGALGAITAQTTAIAFKVALKALLTRELRKQQA